MKKVLIPGNFDLVHIGHFNVIERASKEGDYLIVAIHKDTINEKKTNYFYSVEDRMRIIKSFEFVHEVVAYEKLDELVTQLDFNILCHGPDNYSETCKNAYRWCEQHGLEVVELPRTEGISSTILRDFISNHKI